LWAFVGLTPEPGIISILPKALLCIPLRTNRPSSAVLKPPEDNIQSKPKLEAMSTAATGSVTVSIALCNVFFNPRACLTSFSRKVWSISPLTNVAPKTTHSNQKERAISISFFICLKSLDE
jgi:hypothetical protein